MGWNRCGMPTPPEGDEDHRKCPVCGWLPCLPDCRMEMHNQWDIEKLYELLQEMDYTQPGGGSSGFPIGEEPFLPPTDPTDFVDEGDFE